MKLAPFLEKYPPTDTKPVARELLEKYKDILPYGIIQILHQHGFGKYGGGMIEIIDPEDYMDAMETWLGKRPNNYVPIAVSAFGELFYFRKLTPTDEDVCMIDPHYSQISTCAWMSFSINGYATTRSGTKSFVLICFRRRTKNWELCVQGKSTFSNPPCLWAAVVKWIRWERETVQCICDCCFSFGRVHWTCEYEKSRISGN
jgi:hypothetical protein